MTPAMKTILCGLAEQRLAQVQKEADDLRQAIGELKGEQPATNGVDALAMPQNKCLLKSTSQLQLRLEKLRERHGPVFIIDPKTPVAAGERIKWGKAGKESTVEVLEPAELPDMDGNIVPSRFFAKLVDV